MARSKAKPRKKRKKRVAKDKPRRKPARKPVQRTARQSRKAQETPAQTPTYRELRDRARSVAEARRELKARRRKAAPSEKERGRLERLGAKPWSKLSEKQRADLRSWRGQKAWETKQRHRAEAAAKTPKGQRYLDLIERLGSTNPRTKVAAREEARRLGTGRIARFLRDDIGWDDDDIADAFAFWFYSE